MLNTRFLLFIRWVIKWKVIDRRNSHKQERYYELYYKISHLNLFVMKLYFNQRRWMVLVTLHLVWRQQPSLHWLKHETSSMSPFYWVKKDNRVCFLKCNFKSYDFLKISFIFTTHVNFLKKIDGASKLLTIRQQHCFNMK